MYMAAARTLGGTTNTASSATDRRGIFIVTYIHRDQEVKTRGQRLRRCLEGGWGQGTEIGPKKEKV